MNDLPLPDPKPGRYANLLPFMVAVLISAAIFMIQPLYTSDQSLSDKLLSSQREAVGAPVLVIEIDARDIGTFGGPPIGRDILARVLDRLNAEGARRVLVDMLFTAPMGTDADTLLVDALQRLGPDRVALATGVGDRLRADPMFTSGLPMLDTQLFADKDGWFRSIGSPGHSSDLGNPAIWLATGEMVPSSIPVDLRLDPATVETLSVNELLSGLRGTRNFQDRLVVLTQSTQIGAPRVYLPGYGETNRGMFMVLGAVSHLSDYCTNADFAQRAGLLLAALALVGGFLIVTYSPSLQMTAFAGLGLAVSLVFGNWAIVSMLAGAAVPFTSLLILSTGMLVALFQRTRVASLISVFMKGDMSPEEAWDWRAHGSREEPVFLFAANGRIKRLNPAAQDMVNQVGGLSIASAFLPGFGVRDDQVRLQGRVYSLEWPNAILPLVIARDVTDAAAREKALRTELITDALTGLLNRAGFEKRLEKAASDKRSSYALFYLDMNGFKAVNDTYGHDAGDELLRIAAEAFTGCVRNRDSVARLGGDEFAVLCPGFWSRGDMQTLADDLEASLKEPIALDIATVQVGVAVGFAMPDYGDEPSGDVVKRADQAMYARKAAIKERANAQSNPLDVLTATPAPLLDRVS